MQVTLAPEQLQWLEREVAAGRYRSIEEAVRVAVADLKSARTDDLGWTKPYLDRAREAALRGEVLTLAEHRAHAAACLETTKGG